MKCISVKFYNLKGKIYSLVQKAEKFIFRQENVDMPGECVVFPERTQFACNDTKIYAIENNEKNLKITILPEKKELFYELSDADESIIGETAGNDSLIIRSCRDVSDYEQEVKMYYIDINADKMIMFKDSSLEMSYRMPYISVFEGKEYILAENSKIEPYELDEARQGNVETFDNDILILPFDKFKESVVKDEKLKWDILLTAKEGFFVIVLKVTKSYVWFLETIADETKTNIIKYDFIKGAAVINFSIDNRIDDGIFNEENLLYLYKWNGCKEIIDIYDNQGASFASIDYSEFIGKNEDLELEEIVSVSDERYVTFVASDYSEDEPYQCRVEYDIIDKKFTVSNDMGIESEV